MREWNPVPSSAPEPPGGAAERATAPAVEIRGVHHHYESGTRRVQVLKGLDLTVGAGSFTAILGPSGCGKSTLLNLVGGLERPSAGRIRVFGEDVGGLRGKEATRFRARSISFIFQFFNLLPNLTAEENVLAGLEPLGLPRDERCLRSRRYLGAVGLGGKAGRFPSELSGGEQQRVAIARALARETRLVLADEPTGSLDEATGNSVMDLLSEIRGLRTVSLLMITHDPKIAARADEVAEMKDGRISNPW